MDFWFQKLFGRMVTRFPLRQHDTLNALVVLFVFFAKRELKNHRHLFNPHTSYFFVHYFHQHGYSYSPLLATLKYNQQRADLCCSLHKIKIREGEFSPVILSSSTHLLLLFLSMMKQGQNVHIIWPFDTVYYPLQRCSFIFCSYFFSIFAALNWFEMKNNNGTCLKWSYKP